ncbi:hypothetical protein [Micromonospora haikouensis]|uniref:ApeA N-terminal domain 1-containing protein n=1 Tax=Micromonospora haikouensis TaxID=686309 RepID=UPI00340C9116
MGQPTLEPGDKRTGVFIHAENKSSPCVVGALWIDPRLGVLAEIPYIESGTDQFTTPAQWFRHEQAPRNLLFRSEDLKISLFGCRITRIVQGSHLDIGRLRAQEAVFAERSGDIDDELRVTTLVSHIEGLAEWSGLSSVEWESERIASPGRRRDHRIRYTVQSNQGFDWPQGIARMKLRTLWRHESAALPGIHLTDDTVLESRFHEPRPVSDHLAEHRKFRDLISLITGTGARFLRHSVRDRRFGMRTLEGKIHGADYERLIAAQTVADHYRHASDTGASDWPMLTARNLSPESLTWWGREYEISRRFILPTTSTLQRSNTFAEDRVVNASMSIEALGTALGKIHGEEPTLNSKNRITTATYFYRIIETVGMDSSLIAGSSAELAKALANTYNTIKHASRGDFPDGLHTIYAGRPSLMLIRMAVVRRLPGAQPAVASYASSWPVRRIMEGMKDNGVTVQSGRFSTSP